MASAMPSSAAAVEGLEEGDALDVSSLSLSLAFLREDMFKMSSSGFVLQKVWGLCRKLEPSRICVTLKTKIVPATYNEFEQRSITLALQKKKGKKEKIKMRCLYTFERRRMMIRKKSEARMKMKVHLFNI